MFQLHFSQSGFAKSKTKLYSSHSVVVWWKPLAAFQLFSSFFPAGTSLRPLKPPQTIQSNISGTFISILQTCLSLLEKHEWSLRLLFWRACVIWNNISVVIYVCFQLKHIFKYKKIFKKINIWLAYNEYISIFFPHFKQILNRFCFRFGLSWFCFNAFI